jgi:uncharacterized membrane protein YfcA
MFIVLITFIGILAFVFSMLGLGGAMVYNPIMVWFGYDFKSVVVPTGLLLNGVTALSAAWVYYRQRMIDFRVAFPLIITSAIGAPVGAYFTQFIPTQTLLAIFSMAIIFAGGRMLLFSKSSEPDYIRGTKQQRLTIGGILGFGIGFIAGMLGVGGGFLIVPLLITMGFPTKTAAATSAFIVIFSSFTGFIGHLAVGHFDWQLMVFSVISVFIGSQLGAHTMYIHMKPRQLKQMFGIVLILIALKLIWGIALPFSTY